MTKFPGVATFRSHQSRNRSETSYPPRGFLYAFAALCFAVPLFVWPTASEYGYTKSILALVGVSAFYAAWGIHAWMRRSCAVRIPRVVLPFALLVASALLSMLNAINGSVVLQSVLLLLCFGGVFLLASNLVTRPRDVALILFALLTAGTLAAAYGLLQYAGVVPGGPGGGPLDPIISTMGNRNYLGGYLAYLLVPSILLLVRLRSRFLRTLSLLMMAVCFGVVLLVNQIGTVIALSVAAVALITGWAIFRPVAPISSNRRWLIALMVVAFVVGLFAAPSGPLNSVVVLSDDGRARFFELWSRSSGQTRSEDWWVAIEMFTDHPVFGVGLGNYKLEFVPYKADFLSTARGATYTRPIARAAQAHNEYVQILAEQGVVGTVAALSFLLFLFVGAWVRLRANRDESERFDLLLLFAGMIVFFVHAIVSFPAHLPASSWAAVTLLGLAFSPAYGDRHVQTVHLRTRVIPVVTIFLCVGGIAVSFIAIRDLGANIRFQRGVELLDAGEPAEAEALLAASIRIDFAPRQSYYYLAAAQLQQGKIDQAKENLELCLTRFISEEVYLQLANVSLSTEDLEAADRYLDLLEASHPPAEIVDQTSYLRALIAQRRGDQERAVEILEQLIAARRDYVRAYPALGYVLLSLGREAEAEEVMASGLALIVGRIQELVTVVSTSETVYLTAERYKEISHEVLNLQDALSLQSSISPNDEGAYMAIGDLHQLSAVLQLGSTPQMALDAYGRAASILRSKLALLQAQQERQDLSSTELAEIETQAAYLRDKLQTVTAALDRLEE